jgi:hypothetical protein
MLSRFGRTSDLSEAPIGDISIIFMGVVALLIADSTID